MVREFPDGFPDSYWSLRGSNNTQEGFLGFLHVLDHSFTHDHRLHAKAVLEGIDATGLMEFKGPFTLGIAGHENFEQAAKYTEMSEHSGSLVVCSIAGIIGYFVYPNVLPILYCIGVFGSVSALCLVLMVPNENRRSVVNDDLARNSRHNIFDLCDDFPNPVGKERDELVQEEPGVRTATFKKDIGSKGADDDEGGMSSGIVSSSSPTAPSMKVLE